MTTATKMTERFTIDLPPTVNMDLTLIALTQGTSKRRIVIDLIERKAKECRREIVAFIDKAGGMSSDGGA